MEVCEPAHLPEIRALAAHLEVQPLVAEVSLLQRLVREAVVGVVLFNHILVDGSRLPQYQVRVGVFDSRDATVGIHVGEWLLLDLRETKRLDFVVETELLEEEDCLLSEIMSKITTNVQGHEECLFTFHGFGPGAAKTY